MDAASIAAGPLPPHCPSHSVHCTISASEILQFALFFVEKHTIQQNFPLQGNKSANITVITTAQLAGVCGLACQPCCRLVLLRIVRHEGHLLHYCRSPILSSPTQVRAILTPRHYPCRGTQQPGLPPFERDLPGHLRVRRASKTMRFTISAFPHSVTPTGLFGSEAWQRCGSGT